MVFIITKTSKYLNKNWNYFTDNTVINILFRLHFFFNFPWQLKFYFLKIFNCMYFVYILVVEISLFFLFFFLSFSMKQEKLQTQLTALLPQ